MTQPTSQRNGGGEQGSTMTTLQQQFLETALDVIRNPGDTCRLYRFPGDTAYIQYLFSNDRWMGCTAVTATGDLLLFTPRSIQDLLDEGWVRISGTSSASSDSRPAPGSAPGT